VAQSYAHGNYSHTQKKAHVTGQRSGGRSSRDRTRRELSQNLLVDSDAVSLCRRPWNAPGERPVESRLMATGNGSSKIFVKPVRWSARM
jgi:hypothetical protein